ncbi:3'(2'),5'-bisphosphate nucleotidase CysQ [Cognatishimia sp. SS12]|uniref:3'(2'),5'-bisphosphate nucleotidase CysQ n=1 Tax=Cognatishimia sp. SS12 TaxID=2979465 RepID=UPI00232B0780|nr:3'(2'),5'-bisphosphate nucleotidase CysQ [Cognatishimia sp. SS12]MDC0737908.1 3'(2'),5'-bisphosphate nucleotidase CysQ [Cognatishimia sp. SS12]
MPESDLALLISAAQEAGEIAKSFANASAKVWDKPDGAGPVTEADLAVNDLLEAKLMAARPDYGWLSEESPHNDRRQSTESVFIIDPIDGTRSFIEGKPIWSHSLAIVKHGVVRAAVVYLPMLDRLYSANLGGGATLNGAGITVGTSQALNEADILATRPTLDPALWKDVPGFKRSHRPSLAYRLSLVAQGRFDGMMTLRPTWEWDIAAGDLIAREAGAVSTDKTGTALSYNNPDPRLPGIITSNKTLHQQIISALA